MADPDTKPILLRPHYTLAEAMTDAADDAGMSRQAWMLDVLWNACEAAGHAPSAEPSPDDMPIEGL